MRVVFKKLEIGHSFSILLFLGSVPEKPEEYLTCPYFVGAHHAFVNSAPSRYENCKTKWNWWRRVSFISVAQFCNTDTWRLWMRTVSSLS